MLTPRVGVPFLKVFDLLDLQVSVVVNIEFIAKSIPLNSSRLVEFYLWYYCHE